MSFGVYQRFLGWGRPELGVAYMTMIAFFLMCFTAIPVLFSLYLHSSDYQFLTPLPIPTKYLGLAKLVVVWLYLTGINFVILFPVALLVGLNGGLMVWSLLFSLLLSVVTPTPPLFLSSLAVIRFVDHIREPEPKTCFPSFLPLPFLVWCWGPNCF